MKRITSILLVATLILYIVNINFYAQNKSADSKITHVKFRDRLLPAPVNGGFKMKDYWI